jgi:DnaJ-domain-containing protein 1
MRSLTLALEALRQLERHGGGVMLERAYQGFAALPAPPKPHEILGVAADASADEVRKAWRAKISGAHPDNGGTGAAELNAARDDMLKRLGA